MRTGRPSTPLEMRLWRLINQDGPVSVPILGPCWGWNGTPGKNGYARIAAGGGGGRLLIAHRVAYELLVGPIPEGFDIDHLCHTFDLTCPGGESCPHRRCCNPDHLQPVPPRVNVLRSLTALAAVNARKTHCPQGHPYEGANLYQWKTRSRSCRICAAERSSRWRERHPEYKEPHRIREQARRDRRREEAA